MKTFYLDTSAINRLYDSAKMLELKNAIKIKGEVFLSIFNVVELASESTKERREGLLGLAKDIGGNYRPMAMPNEILKWAVEAVRVWAPDMNYSIGEEWDEVWVMLNEPEQIDGEAYSKIIGWKKNQEQWYQSIHDNGRNLWQEKISNLSKMERHSFASNFSKLIKQYRLEFIASFVSNLANKGTDSPVDNEIAIRLINYSEHWRFFLSSMTYGMFVRSIKTSNFAKSKNPGSIDTQQSIYLTNCDMFITSDIAQYNMLRLINQFGHRKRKIFKFDNFAEWLLS
ncbi:MAG: hypothetical protein FJ134_00040 [Deltaproteobacteria bacterium]|nr:hypothetical protein [Deltaproteobacteria bacterium]